MGGSERIGIKPGSFSIRSLGKKRIGCGNCWEIFVEQGGWIIVGKTKNAKKRKKRIVIVFGKRCASCGRTLQKPAVFPTKSAASRYLDANRFPKTADFERYPLIDWEPNLEPNIKPKSKPNIGQRKSAPKSVRVGNLIAVPLNGQKIYCPNCGEWLMLAGVCVLMSRDKKNLVVEEKESVICPNCQKVYRRPKVFSLLDACRAKELAETLENIALAPANCFLIK